MSIITTATIALFARQLSKPKKDASGHDLPRKPYLLVLADREDPDTRAKIRETLVIGCSPKQLAPREDGSDGVTVRELRACGFSGLDEAIENPDAAVGREISIRWQDAEGDFPAGWRIATLAPVSEDAFRAALAAQKPATKPAAPRPAAPVRR